MSENLVFIVAILGFLIWVFLIYIVAKYGETRRLGFGWTLVIAIFFSPLLALLFAAISGRK